MARLSDTKLTENDPGSSGGGSKWVKDRDLVGYEVKFIEIGTRHVDEHYGQDGTLYKEHDEYIITFEFADDAEAEAVMFGDYEGPGGRYKFSTNAARIKRVLEHVTGAMMPLEGVVICVDQDSKYQSLYLGEATTGDGLPETQTTAPSVPNGRASGRPAGNSPANGSQPAGRSQTVSTGGARPTDRKTTTART